MRTFGYIFGGLLIALALVTLGYDLYRLSAGLGRGFSPLGQIWFDLHPGSLNLVQAVIERYVWQPLWDPGIATILQWPAVLDFAVPGAVIILLSYPWYNPRRRRRWR